MWSSGSLPVFSTPSMIALMEQAAVNAISSAISQEETSVGTAISVSHVAASPVGCSVRAEAQVTKVDGRKLEFSIAAFDDKEKIGEGTHTRVVVDSNRFMSRVSAKCT
eukprot:TRINITY_DN2593_c0_g1_i3.p1 TRINITY_DN2593_c0_g1~~TRINITY_DN2593_c0_g1_i3.p1  ORF type:complete len:108 (+),score=23.59 TRINITY_DN2593_c0_g1_i3:165-488(+)